MQKLVKQGCKNENSRELSEAERQNERSSDAKN